MTLYEFVKIPQSFFVSKKRQLPLQGSLKFRLHFNLIAADNYFAFVGLLRTTAYSASLVKGGAERT